MRVDWTLDQNGTSVNDEKGDQVLDLHNECELTNIHSKDNDLLLQFVKTTDYIHSKQTVVGDKIEIAISGTNPTKLPDFELPANFEGIYDIKPESLTLCIEDECVDVTGQALDITFMLARAAHS